MSGSMHWVVSMMKQLNPTTTTLLSYVVLYSFLISLLIVLLLQVWYDTGTQTMDDIHAIKQHLKKLRDIKKGLKKDPIGTPLRKRDRIDVNKITETRSSRNSLPNDNKRNTSKSRRKNLDEQTGKK